MRKGILRYFLNHFAGLLLVPIGKYAAVTELILLVAEQYGRISTPHYLLKALPNRVYTVGVEALPVALLDTPLIFGRLLTCLPRVQEVPGWGKGLFSQTHVLDPQWGHQRLIPIFSTLSSGGFLRQGLFQ